MVPEISKTFNTEEVGHNHVRIKSGHVAPYITLYNIQVTI